MIGLRIFLLLSLAIIAGCSEESIKRTTYETLQNVREQDCSKTPSVDCENRDRLEVYSDKRNEVLQEE